MVTIIVKDGDPQTVIEEALWLAWQACSPVGMGRFQDKPNATKEDVVKNITEHGDYPIKVRSPTNEYYADYVFGRTMKLKLTVNGNEIAFFDGAPKLDYQAWCAKYPTYADLIKAAAMSIGAKLE